MSSGLYTVLLPIREDKEPDWQAGRDWIAALSDEAALKMYGGSDIWGVMGARFENAIDEVFGDNESEDRAAEDRLTAAAVRKTIADTLGEVEKAITDDGSLVTWHIWDGWRLWMTGGISGGDSPTEAFDPFQGLAEIDALAKAVGFFEKS